MLFYNIVFLITQNFLQCRKFIKKKTDIKTFSSSYIKKIQDWINNYPKKLFNYKSAKDIFYENLNDCLKCCNRFEPVKKSL